MADEDLRYDRMVEEALRGVVARALSQVAERGLPGEHHFYVTFSTEHPGVAMPEQLRARYPSEMTIVLQYQFWGLEIGPDAFSVTLSFSNVPERLTIPFAAITAFADPSVRFGLQFDLGAAGAGAAKTAEDDQLQLGDAVPPSAQAANAKAADRRLGRADDGPGQAEGSNSPEQDAEKVIALDAFRKADGARKK